ncbi:hypothetical protein KJ786_03080 [Patescibacteria group bacterium]|nr:hypothetical protein [Patescibacteria group bacterium]
MNKKIIVGFVIGLGIILILVIASSGSPRLPGIVQDNQNSQNNTFSSQTMQSFTSPEKVEVFLFHATQRCPTCIRTGQLSKATAEERCPAQVIMS